MAFSLAVLGGADHDQYARAIFLQAHIEVDGVGPQVDVALAVQVALRPGLELLLPDLGFFEDMPPRGLPNDQGEMEARGGHVGDTFRAVYTVRFETAVCSSFGCRQWSGSGGNTPAKPKKPARDTPAFCPFRHIAGFTVFQFFGIRRIAAWGQFGGLSKGNGGNKEDEIQTGVPCVRYGDL